MFPSTFILGLVFAVYFLMGIPLQSFAQQSAGNSDPMQQAAKMANITRDWLNGKLSTPGTSGEMHELKRSNESGQLIVTYDLIVKGAPRDQTYSLLAWPINAASPSQQMKGLTISEDGVLVCNGKTSEQCVGDKENSRVSFVFAQPGQGEVFRIALVSADGKTKIFFAAIPDPIIQTSQTCSLEVVRLTPKFELVLVRAKGYQPNEDLLLASKSYDESHDQQAKADNEGRYVSALLPGVKGRQNGKTTLSLKGGGCAPELSFEWGK